MKEAIARKIEKGFVTEIIMFRGLRVSSSGQSTRWPKLDILIVDYGTPILDLFCWLLYVDAFWL
jgi:hypothetical protein